MPIVNTGIRFSKLEKLAQNKVTLVTFREILHNVDPVQNPYSPGAGTPPPALVGRDSLISQFEITLKRVKDGKSSKSVMPTGLRGVGKTVLLNKFADQARDIGYSVAVIEAPETANFSRLLAGELKKVLYDLDRLGAISAAVKRGLRVLKSFTVTPQVGGLPKFEIGIDPEQGQADSGELARDLTDLVVAVAHAAADRNRGLMVAIDEVQYLNSTELAALITAIHRTTQLSLPVVLVGTGLPQLAALAGGRNRTRSVFSIFPWLIRYKTPTREKRSLRRPAKWTYYLKTTPSQR